MLRHHLVLAVKVLLRRKFFTAVSLFGTVATLVVFIVIAALLEHTFGPGAPESRQDRMLSVQRVVQFGTGFQMSSHGSYQLFDRHARNLPGAERLTIFSNAATVDSFVGGQRVPVSLKRTDGEFWQVFDFTFLEGRPYDPRDVAEAQFVAVVTDSTRRALLGQRPTLGAAIEVDGQQFRIVGVVADVPELRFLPYADVWVPQSTRKRAENREDVMGAFQAVVLASGRDALPGIREEFNSRVSRLPRGKGVEGIVAPFETRFEGVARQMQLGNVRSTNSLAGTLILVLSVCGALLALLPAMNLVNLNISRILERASEIGVRKAFGASSRRLVGQFVVENVLLTVMAGLIALVLAAGVLGGINHSGLIAHAALAINVRVFLAGVGLAALFGVASGVYPAWRMARLHPVKALKGETR